MRISQIAWKLAALLLVPAAKVSQSADLISAQIGLDNFVLRFQDPQSLSQVKKESEALAQKNPRVIYHFVPLDGSKKEFPNKDKTNLIEVVEITSNNATASFYDSEGDLLREITFHNGKEIHRKELRYAKHRSFELNIEYDGNRIYYVTSESRCSGLPAVAYIRMFMKGPGKNWKKPGPNLYDVNKDDLGNLKLLLEKFTGKAYGDPITI